MSVDINTDRRCPDCGAVMQPKGRREWGAVVIGTEGNHPIKVYPRVYHCDACDQDGFDHSDLMGQAFEAQRNHIHFMVTRGMSLAIRATNRLHARRSHWVWFGLVLWFVCGISVAPLSVTGMWLASFGFIFFASIAARQLTSPESEDAVLSLVNEEIAPKPTQQEKA